MQHAAIILVNVYFSYTFVKRYDFNMRLFVNPRYWTSSGHAKGSRQGQNVIGPLWRKAKGHYCLWPLFVTMAFGVGISVAFGLRSLTNNIDVSWRHEMTPQNAWRNAQFKVRF